MSLLIKATTKAEEKKSFHFALYRDTYLLYCQVYKKSKVKLETNNKQL